MLQPVLIPRPAEDVTPAQIARAITGCRLPLSSERRLQMAIAELFAAEGIPFLREVRLTDHDRPDFMVGRIVVEVKIKGGRIEIFRQCQRYCAHPDVDHLVLVSNVAMALPPAILGKPATVVPLGRAWL